MLRNYFLIFLIISNVTKYCECILTDTKLNVIESLNEKLNIKHFTIIKDDNLLIDRDIIYLAKKISKRNIFTSFMSVSEMNVSMNEHYKTPIDHYYYGDDAKRARLELLKKRDALVYPPKTIVMPYGDDKLKFSIGKLFTFVIVKNLVKEQDGYKMEEIYHPSLKTYELFVSHFGDWNKAKGLVIREPDFYKRRLDMNGTVLIAEYDVELSSTPDFSIHVAEIISRTMNIRWNFKPSHLNRGENYENWALFSMIALVSYRNPIPAFIGPFRRERTYFYLAYDKNYEQYGISPLLKPFSFDLWMALLGWLIISAISITIISKKIIKTGFNSQIITSDCLYEPFDSILNQDGGKIPAEPSLKLTSIASRIVALILAPLYTGAIASFILIPIMKLPFTNPEEFVQDGSYKLGFFPRNQLDTALNMSSDRWTQKMARNFMTPIKESPDDTQDTVFDTAFKTICDDHKWVLMLSTTMKSDFYCKIIRIRSSLFFDWQVLFLEYESPYRAIFNRIVTWIRSTGNFRNMDAKLSKDGEGDITIIEPKNNNNNNDDDDSDIEIHLTGLAPIFILTSALYAFSVIILFIEIRRKKNIKISMYPRKTRCF